jgi:hypothetical protein
VIGFVQVLCPWPSRHSSLTTAAQPFTFVQNIDHPLCAINTKNGLEALGPESSESPAMKIGKEKVENPETGLVEWTQ